MASVLLVQLAAIALAPGFRRFGRVGNVQMVAEPAINAPAPTLAPTPLADAAAHHVSSWLSGQTLASQTLASDFKFRGDMASVDAAAYPSEAARWHADAQDLLSDFSTEVTRSSQTTDSVNVRWRASWINDSARPLRRLAQLAGWRVVEFDYIAESQRQKTFSWAGVRKLLATAVRTGEIALPRATIEGVARLRFADDGTLLSHDERLDFVADADSRVLRNRLCATDAAAFLDVCRRPSADDPDEWAARTRERVLVGVPGAGTLDIDPAEDPDEERLAAFVLLCVAAAGVVATMVALNGDTSSFAQMPELYLEGSDADILDFLGSGACEPGSVECKFR